MAKEFVNIRKRRKSTSDDCVPIECNITKKSGIDSNEYLYTGEHHASNVLYGLNMFRKSKEFCDVILNVGENKKLFAHKNVLAAVSPHLKNMFQKEISEPVEYIIDVEDIEMEIMNLILEYAYTGCIKITKSNCKRLIFAANSMKIETLLNAASEFFGKYIDIDESTCLEVLNFAQSYNCPNLQKMAINYILQNFKGVVANEDFLELSTNDLIQIISDDELEIDDESFVFSSVMRWFEYRIIDRSNDIRKVLEIVRLPFIDTYFLFDIPSLFPIIKANNDCLKLIEEAKSYHLIPDRYMEMNTIRMTPRKNSKLIQVIAIVGGEIRNNVNEKYSTIECFVPEIEKWYSLSNLPNITRHDVVISGKNNLYIAGGKTFDDKLINRFWRYDFYYDIIQEMSPMLTARHSIGLAAIDGFIYVIGGWDSNSQLLGTMERYDPNMNEWTFFDKLRKPVANAIVLAYNNILYVGGGLDSLKGDITSDFYQYEPKTNIWTALPSLLIPRCAAASSVLNGYIYIIGGCYTSIEFTNRVERYNIKNGYWEEVCPMKERRGGAAAAVLNGKIYVFGGKKERPPYPDDIECYDPVKQEWSIVGKLLSPRAWFGCTSLIIKKSCCKEVNVIEIVD